VFFKALPNPGLNSRMLQKFLVGEIADAVLLGIMENFLLMRNEQRAKVGALVSEHDGLKKERVCENATFDILRRNVLPSRGDDDVFLAIRDMKNRSPSK